MNQAMQYLERVPPQSFEDEVYVLGSMMVDKKGCENVIPVLEVQDFYNEENRKIYNAILSLYLDNGETDMLSVYNELGREIDARKLQDMIDSVTTIDVAKFHAKRIKDLARRRKLIEVCIEGEIHAYENEGKTEEIINILEGKINILSGVFLEDKGFIHIKEIVPAILKRIDENRKGTIVAMKTGFSDLDNKIGSLDVGDMTIIGAKTSVGKTSFLVSLVDRMVDKFPIAGFFLEEKKEVLAGRLISQRSGVPFQKMYYGRLDEEELQKVINASQTIVGSRLFIDDQRGMTILQLKNKLSKLITRNPVKIVFMDYLQLIKSNLRNGNRNDQVTEIVTEIKNMAGEFDVHMIILSQLTRNSSWEKRKPQISDLRDSGSIEQVAENILLLHRGDLKTGSLIDATVADLIIAKQKLGPVGEIQLTFIPETMKYENISYLDIPF